MENLLNGFMLRLRLNSELNSISTTRTIHQSCPEITAGKKYKHKKDYPFGWEKEKRKSVMGFNGSF